MSLTDKHKKVVSGLAEDKAKRDASYEYDEKSKEPIAEGAFKGALASGLASRFIPAAKKGGSNWKSHAANLAVGVTGGALLGKKYNENKVNEAKKARRWLSDKRKEKEYIKSTEDIYKSSNIDNLNKYNVDPYKVAEDVAEDRKPKKRGIKELATDTLGGTAIGAALSVFSKGKYRKINMGRGAAIGGAGGAVSDVVDNGSEDSGLSKSRAGQVAAMGASFGASGAVDPLVNRLTGRLTSNKSYIAKEKKENLANIKKGKVGGKTNINSDFVIGHRTRGKPLKTITKGLGRPTLKAAGKYGLAGLGVGLGIDQLTQYLERKKLEKKASIHFSAKEAVSAKKYKEEEKLKKSFPVSTAIRVATAGAGYGIARKILGPKAGPVAAAAGLTYLVGSTAKDLIGRYNAKEYLKLNRSGKLSVLKEDVDDNEVGPGDIYKAVVLNRVIN